jgi:hypothetical protein
MSAAFDRPTFHCATLRNSAKLAARLIGQPVARSALNAMAWFKKDKDQHRFYLLPGMGGSSLRRKQKVIMRWTLAVGILVSALVGVGLYFLGRR